MGSGTLLGSWRGTGGLGQMMSSWMIFYRLYVVASDVGDFDATGARR